jgi:hypothetical protein
MADEIDISSALPFEFEVEIRHRADLLRQLANRYGSIQLGLTDSEEEIIDFKYEFGSVLNGTPDGTQYRFSHPIEATAVDLVIANEIFDRIGIYIADALQASVQPLGDNNFFVRDGVLVARPEYASVFDLSTPVLRPTTTKIVFNVTDVILTSPTKVRAYLAAAMIGLAAPAAPAATAAQTSTILSSVANIVGPAISGGTLYYTIKVGERTVRESLVNDKVKYYQEQIKKHQLKAIQFDLSLVAGYQGLLDGKVGPEFLKAKGRTASKHNLSPNIDYNDPIFLRALASDTLDYKPPR